MKRISVGLAADASLLSAGGGVDVIVLPELVDGGYAALTAGRGKHREGDIFLKTVRAMSGRRPMTIVAGSVALEGKSGNVTNSAIVFSRGRQIHRYDKIHLFRPTGDHRFFVPGRAFGAFTFRSRSTPVKAGVIICYDLRFPELVRALARERIEILFVPARWPRIRDAAWRTLLRARAIENQIVVVGCNARGAEGGYSYAFDPFGREIFSGRRSGGGKFQRFVVDVDLIRLAHRHHRNIEEARVLREIRFPRRLRPTDDRPKAVRPSR
jgi:omega-amidase